MTKIGKRLKSYRGGKATVTRNQKIKYAGKLTEIFTLNLLLRWQRCLC